MKKKLLLLVAAAAAVSVSADMVSFRWTGGLVSDGIVNAEPVLTFLDGNASGLIMDKVVDGKIDISELVLFVGTEYATMPAVVAPFGPAKGQWGTAYMEDLAAIDQNAYAVVGAFEAVVGSTFMVSEMALVKNLFPAGQATPDLPQDFDPGAMTSVEVVPEPATFGLMGIAGLGMFLARRKARR